MQTTLSNNQQFSKRGHIYIESLESLVTDRIDSRKEEEATNLPISLHSRRVLWMTKASIEMKALRLEEWIWSLRDVWRREWRIGRRRWFAPFAAAPDPPRFPPRCPPASTATLHYSLSCQYTSKGSARTVSGLEGCLCLPRRRREYKLTFRASGRVSKWRRGRRTRVTGRGW